MTPPTTTASPPGGSYDTPRFVTLSADETATIYYTTDGTNPDVNSGTYAAPIPITATTILKFFARDAVGNSESIKTEVYSILGYGWTVRMGDADYDFGNAVSTDPSGNIYATGNFYGTVDFGADFGTSDSKTALGYYDVFVTRVNSNGSYGWTRRIGDTAANDWGRGITADRFGNIYVTGRFDDTVNFGADFGEVDSKVSAGQYDIFVTKINSNGSYGWTRHMGGSDEDDGHGITTDPVGNIYVTGYFSGTVDFDFGAGTDLKTSAGWHDIFVTKINSNGSYGWTRQMGGSWDDAGLAITADQSGNVYLTGHFYDTVDFDFGAGTDLKTANGQDIFVTRVNSNGSYGWTRQIGDYEGRGITADQSGNICLIGSFLGTVDFGADFGTSDSRTAWGGQDIFVTRIDSNGNYGWTRQIGGTNFDYGNAITSDPSGNIYAAGSFADTVDFGLDFGTSDSKTSAGSSDIFITRINPDGTYGWTRQMGASQGDGGYGIARDVSGNFYLTGRFESTVNFGADFGIVDNKTSAGDYDIFITKVIP